jgi:hypothetical protein
MNYRSKEEDVMDWRVKVIGGQNGGKEFIIRNSSYDNAIEEVWEDLGLSMFNNSYERLEVEKLVPEARKFR